MSIIINNSIYQPPEIIQRIASFVGDALLVRVSKQWHKALTADGFYRDILASYEKVPAIQPYIPNVREPSDKSRIQGTLKAIRQRTARFEVINVFGLVQLRSNVRDLARVAQDLDLCLFFSAFCLFFSAFRWGVFRRHDLEFEGPDLGDRSVPLSQKAEKIRVWMNDLKNRDVLTKITDPNLSQLGLTTLPPEIGLLTSLRFVKLKKNSLQVLPPEILHLVALVELDIRENLFKALPPELEGFPAGTVRL